MPCTPQTITVDASPWHDVQHYTNIILTRHPWHDLGMEWHIYITYKKKGALIGWRGEGFSRWIQVEFPKIGLEITQKNKNWKNFLKEFKSSFSSWVKEHPKIKRTLWKSSSQVSQLLSLLYIKKNVYRDDKLEEDSKCKTRRKMNWKMIQSVKQEGKRSGVWKKVR